MPVCAAKSPEIMTVRITVRFNAADTARFLAGSGGPVATDLLRRGIRVQTVARRLCRVDTGRLRSSIGVSERRQRSLPVVVVGSDVEYAPFVGTRACKECWGDYLRDALPAAA